VPARRGWLALHALPIHCSVDGIAAALRGRCRKSIHALNAIAGGEEGGKRALQLQKRHGRIKGKSNKTRCACPRRATTLYSGLNFWICYGAIYLSLSEPELSRVQGLSVSLLSPVCAVSVV
jgi:hypothetical protein